MHVAKVSRLVMLLTLAAGLLSVGCAPYRSSRSCGEISAAHLRALIEDTTSVEQAVAQVCHAYHVARDDVEVTGVPGEPGGGDLGWTVDGVHYKVAVRSSRVVWARMTYESDPPSADQVMRCWGVPEAYIAAYCFRPQPLRHRAALVLYYPALGVACWAGKYGHGEHPPQFDGNVPIEAFDFVPLGSREAALVYLLSRGRAQTSDDRIWHELDSWPATWQEIKFRGSCY
jgi:hypothetical protein